MIIRLWPATLALLLLLPTCIAQADKGKGAVVFVYHHVANDTPPSTSVRSAQFRKHLKAIDKSDYDVWPLRKIIAHIRKDKAFDQHVISITFDDGYASVYDNAYPLLKKRDYPFTVFVPGKQIGDTPGLYTSWDQLAEMADNGAHIGNHSYSHQHFVRRKAGETRTEWLTRFRADIAKNQEILRDKLGDEAVIKAFAYPYGEYTGALAREIADMGYTGIGQHSGALGPDSDLKALTRYPVATGFADMNSFTTKMKSRYLPAVPVNTPGRIINPGDRNPPRLNVRIPDGPYDLKRLRCFASGQGRINVERVGRNRFTIQADSKFGSGRAKYNCTVPAKESGRVFYWYSYLWLIKTDDKRWWAE